MPGRKPSDAYKAFIGPIKGAVACVGNCHVHVSSGGQSEPGRLHSWMLGSGGEGLSLVNGWHLKADMQYELVQIPRRPKAEQWKVSTRGYMYSLYRDGKEVIAFHWHPAGQSLFKDPHLHLKEEGMLANLHVPTERVSFEAVVRFIIGELRVPALRPDWEKRLDRSEGAFQEYRSWHGSQRRMKVDIDI